MECPHCRKHFHDTWTYTFITKDREQTWGLGHTICAACQRAILALGDVMRLATGAVTPRIESFGLVYPKGSARSPIPSEVPREFTTDYREACLVLPDSEKASAALSRRCLQHLLREKAMVKKDDLAREIQQVLDSKQLPGHLAEDLDAIRNIGNFAAHPMKSTQTGAIVDVEPQEAEWLLNLLEGLLTFTLCSPPELKQNGTL